VSVHWPFDDGHFRQLARLKAELRHIYDGHCRPPEDLDEFELMHWAELRESIFRNAVEQLLAELKQEAINGRRRRKPGRLADVLPFPSAE